MFRNDWAVAAQHSVDGAHHVFVLLAECQRHGARVRNEF